MVNPDGSYVVTGGVSRFKQNSDNLPRHLVYQSLEGDGSIIVRVSDLSAAPRDTMAGIALTTAYEPSRPGYRVTPASRTWRNARSPGSERLEQRERGAGRPSSRRCG